MTADHITIFGGTVLPPASIDSRLWSELSGDERIRVRRWASDTSIKAVVSGALVYTQETSHEHD